VSKREFWIELGTGSIHTVKPECGGLINNFVHVIENSAYRKAIGALKNYITADSDIYDYGGIAYLTLKELGELKREEFDTEWEDALDKVERFQKVCDEFRELIEHAIHLGYLGEGSTRGWAKRTLADAKKLKEK